MIKQKKPVSPFGEEFFRNCEETMKDLLKKLFFTTMDHFSEY